MKLKSFLRWLAVALAAVVVVFAIGLLVLRQWIHSDDFRQRAEQQASTTLGVPVKLRALSVDVWPVPAIALDQVTVQTQPPLTLGRAEIRPLWAPLLQRRLEISTLLVRDAVLPQPALAGLAAALQKNQKPVTQPRSFQVVPRKVLLENITWVNDKGQANTVDVRAQLGDDAWPTALELDVKGGRFQGAKAQLKHEQPQDPWQLQLDIGGGRLQGQFTLTPAKKPGMWKLQGAFDSQDIEVSALSAPSRTLTGKLKGHTTLQAELRNPGELANTLRSQTRFTIKQAMIHGVDLLQAVKTVGLNRSGSTQLDQLSGEFITQGRAMRLEDLVAQSGQLSATGHIALAPSHALNGSITVDLKASGGIVGIPLTVSGTLQDPSVALSKSALIGATLGTLVAPGLGTTTGAKWGDKVGRWWSGEK